MSAVAYTWRSGLIEFGCTTPEGAVVLPTADRDVISAVARHAYDGETLLVPGIPEAEDDEEALEALEEFCASLSKRTDGRS